MGKFVYKKRTVADVKKMVETPSNVGGVFTKSNAVLELEFGASYTLRFLPPNWDYASDCVLPVYFHDGIADEKIVSLRRAYETFELRMNRADILTQSESRLDAFLRDVKNRDDDMLYDDDIYPKVKERFRFAAWVVARNQGSEPRIVMLTKREWETICKHAYGDDIAQISPRIFNAANGRDISFTYGKEINSQKRYGVFDISVGKPSPIYDDERQTRALDYIKNNPLPSMINIVSADYISAAVDSKWQELQNVAL